MNQERKQYTHKELFAKWRRNLKPLTPKRVHSNMLRKLGRTTINLRTIRKNET